MRLFSSLLLFIFFSNANAQDDWELKKDEDGIMVYTRLVEGSNMKAIKATTEFHASLETCMAVLRDIPYLIELFPDCAKAEKISQSDTSQVHYLELKAPWPVADRDGVFLLTYSFDTETSVALVDAITIEGSYPLQEGKVRLINSAGTWSFKRLDNGHTKLVYLFHGNPGGTIPAWLANSVVEENPLEMLKNFHRLVQLDRYAGKTFGFLN